MKIIHQFFQYRKWGSLIGLFFCCVSFLPAQSILINEGVQAAGLWCFPLFGDANTYLYLSSDGQLGTKENGLPDFSYLRYVTEKETTGGVSTVNNANGGAVLHLLSLYSTPAEQVTEAQAILREKLDNKELQLKSPVVFKSGRYNVISSILKDGKEEKKLITTGEAPVLENSKIALSFPLDQLKSKLLLESFKMSTPDVSLTYEMTFSGLSDEFEAQMEIDWDEVQKSELMGGGINVYVVSADIEKGMDELFENKAIKFTQIGENSSIERLVEVAYAKLTNLLFDRVELADVPSEQQGGIGDAITGMIENVAKEGIGSIFSLGVTYKRKDIKRRGKGTLTFKGRSVIERKHYITFNIGNLYELHGDNEAIFKDVPLWDPAFQQREVFVGIDGETEREFSKMVNSVTVKLKKEHQDGSVTMKEMVIDRKTFQDSLGRMVMRYLNQKDTQLDEWLNYHYQTVWKFKGGGSFTSEWIPENGAMINLYSPFTRKIIELEGDPSILKDAGIRVVSVKLSYPFFDQQKTPNLYVKPTDNLKEKNFEITLPKSESGVDYSIVWRKENGETLKVDQRDDFGVIFIDELPNNENKD